MTERQKLFLLSARVSNCTPGWTLRTIDINITADGVNQGRVEIDDKMEELEDMGLEALDQRDPGAQAQFASCIILFRSENVEAIFKWVI